MNRKIAGRLTVAFIIILVGLTFFSRSVQYLLTPKVVVNLPKSGSLSYPYSLTFSHYEGEGHPVYLPLDLDKPLPITEVLVRAGDSVTQGQDLARFSQVHGEAMLVSADIEMTICRNNLSAWDEAAGARERELMEELDELNVDTGNVGKKQGINAELNAIRKYKLFEGISRIELEAKLEDCYGILNTLSTLQSDDWWMKAPVSGTIREISGEAVLSGYQGMREILTIIPEDTEILAVYTVAGRIDADYAQYSVQSGATSLSWELVRTANADGACFVYFLTNGDEAGIAPGGATLMLRSQYHTVLVPNSAVLGDSVYVVNSADGAWGEQVVAREVKVTVGDNDATHTAILSGLSAQDAVIEKWDGPVSNGASVIITDSI